jgi:hypothetical protein
LQPMTTKSDSAASADKAADLLKNRNFLVWVMPLSLFMVHEFPGDILKKSHGQDQRFSQ